MAQDPERDEDQPERNEIDTSHGLDMAAVYHSDTVDAEIEADVIRGLLESHGIPSMILGPTQFPVFGFEVHVPKAQLDEARRIIEEAEAAGPDAAAEAEAGSEEGGR
jgi:hypothetical protein